MPPKRSHRGRPPHSESDGSKSITMPGENQFHVSNLQQMLSSGGVQNVGFQQGLQEPRLYYPPSQEYFPPQNYQNVPVVQRQDQRAPGWKRHQDSGKYHGNNRVRMTDHRFSHQHQQQQQISTPVPPVSNATTSKDDSIWSKKKLYAMVKAFVDDPNAEEMSFPPTLSATERHLVHQAALNFSLHHRSSGSKSERVLTLKKIGSVITQEKNREVAALSGVRVKTIDGYQGAQSLPDEYVKARLCDIRTLIEPFLRKMYKQLKATAEKQPRHRHLTVVQAGLKEIPHGSFPPQRYRELQEFRKSLPSYIKKDDVIDAVRKSSVLIVSGDTGCGKTTQIPQILYDSNIFPRDLEIICTQPRRISALSVAQRVAEERAEVCGDSCGYIIRFDNMTSSKTKIVYMTTGILLRRLQTDPELNGVACIIVDEVHERDVETDFCLLLLRDRLIEQQKNPQRYKNNVKVVVMSATIQIEKVESYFTGIYEGKTPLVISIPGTLFHVEEYFLEEALRWANMTSSSTPVMSMLVNDSEKKRDKDDISRDGDEQTLFEKIKDTVDEKIDRDPESLVPYDLILKLISCIHRRSSDLSESILIFLPGWASISNVTTMIQRSPMARELSVLQLHSSLTAADQQRVFQRPPKRYRKVVLSTNIAEASVTIDDIVYVIDSCLTKGTSYDPNGNVSALKATYISKANGLQRRGRAGRCRAGICFHLLPRSKYENLPEFLSPEIMRSPLEEVCLQAKALKPDEDCKNVLSRAMDSPKTDSIDHAVRFLKDIGAFTSEKEQLTNLGRALSKLPIHPLLGKMLLAAACLGVLDPIVTIAAFLSGKSPFIKPLPHQKTGLRQAIQTIDDGLLSDHLSVLKLFNSWKKSNCSADYAIQQFADHTVLRSMDRIRNQLLRLVKDSSLLRRVKDPMQMASRHSDNLGLVRLVALWSIYPRIATVEYRANRDRKRPNIFCWDNKAAQITMGSALAMRRRDDFNDRSFIFYHERMHIEADLTIFDATSVTSVEAALCIRELTVRRFTEVPPAFLTDEESKMAPAFPFTLKNEEEAKDLGVLFFDGDKKVYVTSLPVALLLRDVRDCMDYYLALSIKEVRADLFPEDLVRALSYTIGYPLSREVKTCFNEACDTAIVALQEDEEQGPIEPDRTNNRNTQWEHDSDNEDDAPEMVVEDFDDFQLSEEEKQRVVAVFGELAILNRQAGSRLLGAFEKGERQRQDESDLHKKIDGDAIVLENYQNADDDDDDDIILAKVGELAIRDEEW